MMEFSPTDSFITLNKTIIKPNIFFLKELKSLSKNCPDYKELVLEKIEEVYQTYSLDCTRQQAGENNYS